jgi:hypothetical protein
MIYQDLTLSLSLSLTHITCGSISMVILEEVIPTELYLALTYRIHRTYVRE